MAAPKKVRGEIEKLPSGSLRVRVYAGLDPLTSKRHYLTEIIPPGPRAAREAEKARTRLLSQVDEQRNPRTRATVNQLLDRHLEMLAVEETTLDSYESFVRNHIRPLIGHLQVGRINGEILDSFYRTLARCRQHCNGKPFREHHTADDAHLCDERCKPHVCRPLAAGSMLKIQAILNKAGKRAVRWEWIGRNPFELTEPIPVPHSEPRPPTAEQAAVISGEAWRDLDWGMMVWLFMTTGARRGEVCALRWERFDPDAAVLVISSSIAQRGGRTWEKDTKTHQQRRIALDEQTTALLVAYRQLCADRSDREDMPDEARIFSPTSDGSTWVKPDTVSQRYERMCARIGWDMHIHQLRHYSATELIAAGVDVRTVAGRLGHGGGGTTTLKVYSAFVAEADQRAAGSLVRHLPALPARLVLADGSADLTALEHVGDPDSPYQRIAADLRGAVVSGILTRGAQLPTVDELAGRYAVSHGTAQRAIAVLRTAGLVTVSRGRRAVVRGEGEPVSSA